MGTQGTGRKRSTKKERTTAEDDALNLIAREAEARLAAKRAARAEAREIRMKELERQQKELSDDDERMSVGSRGSVRVEDRDYLEKGSRAASALTAATLTSLGGTSSRRGSGETAITVDAETSVREIKEIHELKDQIQDVEIKYTQNLKEVKDALTEVEEKYRKAMVSNAQLDNEKTNLMYQVDTLKDSLMELEELLSESRRAHEEKVKEYEREKHAHSVLQFQFNEMKEMLKQSEELLNKHGIVLGPDLNINGDVGETEVDGSSGADPASQPAQDSQTSPTEGNSMLGNTEETKLRSSEEEEVDPEQHQDTFEEAKENHLSSDTLCNDAGMSTLETQSEEQPTQEQQTCVATEGDNTEESGISKDSNVDSNECSVTEAKDTMVHSSMENVLEPEAPEQGDLRETSNSALEDTEGKTSSVDTQSDDLIESCNNLSEKQEKKQDNEESNFRKTESCPQQDVVKGSLPDESIPPESNTKHQQEPENAEEAEHDEADLSKPQPQEATASGKKKRKKKRGKKRGGTHEGTNEQKDGTKKEKGKEKTEKDIELTSGDKGPMTGPDIDGSVTESLKESEESKVNQVKSVQDMKETEEVDGVEGVKHPETFSHVETPNESRTDPREDEQDKEQTPKAEKVEIEVAATIETLSYAETCKEISVHHDRDEQKDDQSLETGAVEAVEEVAPTETLSRIETLKESRTESKEDEQDEEQTRDVEEGSITSPVPEANLSTSDLIDNSKSAENTDHHDKLHNSSEDNSKSEEILTNDNVISTESEILDSPEDEVGSVDDMKSKSSNNNPENTFDTNCKENTEAQLLVSSHDDIAAADSESANNSESKDKTSVSLSSTDGFTDDLRSLSGSEPPSELSAPMNSGNNDDPIEVSESSPEEVTATVKDELKAETDQESLSASQDGNNAELNPNRTAEQDLNENLREHEGLVVSDHPEHDEKSDSCDGASLTNMEESETLVQAEQLDDVESQPLQSEGKTDETNAEESSETEEIHSIDIVNTPDSPKEAPEIGPSTEQDHSAEEPAAGDDPAHIVSQKDEQSEMHLEHPSTDKSEHNDSSQPTLQDSEDVEDEEGQSFDFDDMDVEDAIATNPKEEEVEEGVEVMSDGSSNDRSSNNESCENAQDELVESNDKKCMVDGSNQADTLGKESDTVPQEQATSENVCEKQENMPEEDVGVAEGGQVVSVVETGVAAENINQAVSLPVEEKLDANKMQGEDLVLPKSEDQVASSKDPPQTGKEVKKNGKKGKGKGKEECKMS